MNQIDFLLSELSQSRKGYLCRFFKVNQWIKMSHWGKNTWFQILRVSLFGEIAENTAVEILGHEMVGPCTIAICSDDSFTRLYVADKIGASYIDLSKFTNIQLERLAGILNGRIFPADIDPYESRKARQDTLQAELASLEKQYPSLYLAGV